MKVYGVAALVFLATTQAHAGCMMNGGSVNWGGSTTWTLTVSDGYPCRTTFRIGRRSGISDVSITRFPRHGAATTQGYVNPDINYKPAKGYKGADSFAFTITGGSPMLNGTSTIEVAVEVR